MHTNCACCWCAGWPAVLLLHQHHECRGAAQHPAQQQHSTSHLSELALCLRPVLCCKAGLSTLRPDVRLPQRILQLRTRLLVLLLLELLGCCWCCCCRTSLARRLQRGASTCFGLAQREMEVAWCCRWCCCC